MFSIITVSDLLKNNCFFTFKLGEHSREILFLLLIELSPEDFIMVKNISKC